MTHPTKEEAAYATLERYGFTYLGGIQWKPPLGKPPKLKLTDDELYVRASAYANNRKKAYQEGMKAGRCPKKTEEELGWLWVAHVDGYREAYWMATDDTRHTTDPYKEKNT
jgi:hypothetical protein